MNATLTELIACCSRWAASDGLHATPWPALQLVRASATMPGLPALYEPGLVFVLQGRKTATLGNQVLTYDPQHYLVVSLTSLPVGQIVRASAHEPYLCLRLAVDPQELAELARHAAPTDAPATTRALQVARMSGAIEEALLRLMRLLDSPRDLPVLAALVVREICWRALAGELGPQLRALATADSHAARIARAIELVKSRYDEPLRIDDLALAAHMSTSSLYHHFRQITTLSPLQYQKQLRLHQARRMMLAEGLDAATAAHRVGYESPSQFSREYRRLFGAPPRAEVQSVRETAIGSD